MTREELQTKTKAELQSILDEEGIDYNKRATNEELINLIMDQEETSTDESTDSEEPTDQESEERTAEDEETTAEEKESINLLYSDYQDLIDDDSFMVVPGQTLKVITKDESDEIIEGIIDADLLLDGHSEYIAQLEEENHQLDGQAMRDVIGYVPHEKGSKSSIAISPEELENNDFIPADVRLIPNQQIQSRNRGGHTFTNQWSTYFLTPNQLRLIQQDQYLETRAVQEQ